MKFATWTCDGIEQAGIFSHDMQTVFTFKDAGLDYLSLLEFIIHRQDGDMEHLQEFSRKQGRPVNDISLLAPIPQPHHDIICLGLNYREHAEESTSFLSENQNREDSIYFAKRVIRAIGPEGAVESHIDLESRLDYEAELALIIGRTAHRVNRKDAWDYVFGICCFNDISARDLQHRHKQWYFGKSLDTFTAFGPYIVTLDEFTLPLCLNIRSRVNGETRQNSNTSQMIYSPQDVIAELSAGMTLDAGSIIATGTPVGVGAGSTPPRCMKPGDVCEIEIDGCGVLRNQIVQDQEE